jgi:serine/threonine protein kinase
MADATDLKGSTSSACRVERRVKGAVVLLRLAGVLDERFDSAQVFNDLPSVVVLDLAQVTRITSYGVRQWADAMKALPQSVHHLYVLHAPACYVDQLNMVLNFGGRAEVVSATALYFCERCQEERAISIDVLNEHALLASGAAPPTPCPTCHIPMALEDDPQQAFRYVGLYGAKTLDAETALVLVEEGLYTPRKIGPPPEELKLVHGEVTLLVLSGTLDQRFRPRRLASGVEGEVVLDVGGVVGCDMTGLERFTQLLQSFSGAGAVTLVDVPDALLREINSGTLALGPARLHSALVSIACPTCGTEQRAHVARGFPPPRCASCGEALLSLTGMDALFASGSMPTTAAAVPEGVLDLIRRRAELLSRARAESGARDQKGSSTLGRYRVLRPLSRGGMAEILLAVHEGIGGFEKLIALKKIRRKLLERRHVAVELFLNEAKIVANLNHPNIVQTFEVGEHGGDLFIAMEYVHGVDARTIVKKGAGKRLLGVEQILYLGTQVAAALDHAHKARDINGRPLQIVHRDVSLSNIVVGFDGQVKLVDFGIATATTTEAPGATKDGLVGKFSYMSPEQVRKDALDGRSDVFSLGIVLFELIAGKPLFRRATDEETLRAVGEGPIPSLAPYGVAPEVEAVLTRALARPLDERYADARAFELALQAVLQKQGGMSAHQLALTMRSLFPVESAAAPTATGSSDLRTSAGTPSGDQSGSHSGPHHHSGTFAQETGVTGAMNGEPVLSREDTRGTGKVMLRPELMDRTPASEAAAKPEQTKPRASLSGDVKWLLLGLALSCVAAWVVWLLLRGVR